MSMLIAVAVRDQASDAFMAPSFFVATGAAVRSFADQVNGEESILSKHPEHFELFEIGLYDTEKGQLLPYESPKSIAVGLNMVQRAAVDPRQLQLVK